MSKTDHAKLVEWSGEKKNSFQVIQQKKTKDLVEQNREREEKYSQKMTFLFGFLGEK